MYPITNAVKALFDAEQKQVLRITGTDKNGATISITDADVMIGGFNIDRYCCNGQKLEIGTAIAAQMELKLNNANGAFDSIVFEGAELFVEMGIADWTQSNPTVYYIPIGYFTPDQQPRRLATISLKALDRMTRFDSYSPTLMPWTTQGGEYITDSQGNVIYFLVEIAFPKTIAQLVADVCSRCNVPFTQSLSSFPNYDYVVTKLPSLQQKISYRNLIQWCAGIMGTCAYIDWNGELKFGWYATANYTCTTSNRYASDLYENDLTFTGVSYTNTQGATIVSGSMDYTIDMTGNYLMESAISTLMPAVKNAINGFTYRPFAASVIAAPYLWPLDIITFTDKDGNDHNCCVTNVNFGLNGVTNIEGKGQTEQMNDGVMPVGATSEQALMIEQAYEATVNLDKSLDQEGVFNRLTNNGAAQGIYIINGQVYVNASYIQTGTMVANRIKGGTLTLGGMNNENGVLTVLDANGDTIGTWNQLGITMSKGNIAGPSIVVGGNNDEDGTLVVNDSNGHPVVTLDSDGIEIKEGSIELGSSYGFFVDEDGNIAIGSKPYDTSNLDSGDSVQFLNSGIAKVKNLYVYGFDGVGQCALITPVTNGDGGIGIYGSSTSDFICILYPDMAQFNNNVQVGNDLYVIGDASFGNGATGSFTTADGKTVTVTAGVITSIVNTGVEALTIDPSAQP